MSRGRTACLALGAVLLGPALASGQCSEGTTSGDVICVFSSPRWAGEFAALSANGLLGGLTAGLTQRFRGGSFQDGFMRGLLGGAVSWAGKRVAAERFDGAGLIGRQVSAAGASLVRNASEARPLLDRLMLPVGPVWLEFGGPDRRVHARLDVAAMAWTVYAVAEPELELDRGRSLSSGAFVFRTRGKLLRPRGNDEVAGTAYGGVVFLADVPAYGAAFAERAFAHERIHVLQEDQFAIQVTDPALRWAVARVGLPPAANRYMLYNVSAELLSLLGGIIPTYRDRPWELEATFFAR
ncbi:MAG: hypothetical protein PVH00_09765 [Gemmatimonadota bacterium]